MVLIIIKGRRQWRRFLLGCFIRCSPSSIGQEREDLAWFRITDDNDDDGESGDDGTQFPYRKRTTSFAFRPVLSLLPLAAEQHR
jgi:hypothetical protein